MAAALGADAGQPVVGGVSRLHFALHIREFPAYIPARAMVQLSI